MRRGKGGLSGHNSVQRIDWAGALAGKWGNEWHGPQSDATTRYPRIWWQRWTPLGVSNARLQGDRMRSVRPPPRTFQFGTTVRRPGAPGERWLPGRIIRTDTPIKSLHHNMLGKTALCGRLARGRRRTALTAIALSGTIIRGIQLGACSWVAPATEFSWYRERRFRPFFG